jgi:hypothetical protein
MHGPRNHAGWQNSKREGFREARAAPARWLQTFDHRKFSCVPLSPMGTALLFEVFSQRYEPDLTIVTSNLLCRS